MFGRFFSERRQTQSGRDGRDTAPSNVVRVTHPTLASLLPPLAWKTRKNNARSAYSCYLSWPEFYSPANRWVRGRWLKSHCLPVGWLDILNNKTQHSLNNQNPIPPRHTDPTLPFPASFWPQLFKRWITLSTGWISIHWIAQLVFLILINWIEIHLVDSAIQRFNNRARCSTIFTFRSRSSGKFPGVKEGLKR